MFKLKFIYYYFVLISILYQPVKSNEECQCINENNCLDQFVRDTIEPIKQLRQNNKCPSGEVCCYYSVEEREDPNIIDDASFDECGIRNHKNYNDKLGEFPWMVTIIKNNNTVECGGTIISPSVVLTAAHCLHDQPTDTFTIRAVDWDLLKTTESSFKYKSKEIKYFIIHKDFNSKTLHNDIALIFLSTPFMIKSLTNSICLRTFNTNFDQQQNCITSGWGKYDLESKLAADVNILESVEDLKIIPHNECNKMLKTYRKVSRSFNFHDSFMCAGDKKGNKDICLGDDGGPLICESMKNPGQYFLVGIVSWRVGCNRRNEPGVYVNVAKFLDWIDEQMVAEGFDEEMYYYSNEFTNPLFEEDENELK